MMIDALSPDGPGCKKLEPSTAVPFAGWSQRVLAIAACQLADTSSCMTNGAFCCFQPKSGSRHQKDMPLFLMKK